MTIDLAALEALRAYDTPTLANAIDGRIDRPSNAGYTRPPVHSVLPSLPAMVGYAITLTIRSETPFPSAEAKANAMLPGSGCLWGEVNSTICAAMGCEGVVTDGLVRDLPDVEALGFRLLARGVGVARAWVAIESVGVPVTVGGTTFEPGDVVHADRHGALVIPASAAPSLPSAADAIISREQRLLEWVRSDEFDPSQIAARRAQH